MGLHKIHNMMTSSNGNIFRVTGHLCLEFTGPCEFPAQKQVTQSFEFSVICVWIHGWVNKQSWCWWFETLSCPLWRHCNDINPVGTRHWTTSKQIRTPPRSEPMDYAVYSSTMMRANNNTNDTQNGKFFTELPFTKINIHVWIPDQNDCGVYTTFKTHCPHRAFFWTNIVNSNLRNKI